MARQSAAQIKRVLEKMARPYRENSETFLANIEQDAHQKQKEKGDSKPITDLLLQVQNLKCALRGDYPREAVAWEAFTLGRLHKEAKFERFVPDAQLGWKVREGGRNSGRARRASETAIKTLREYTSLVGNGMGSSSAAHCLARKYRVGVRAIWGRISKAKKEAKK